MYYLLNLDIFWNKIIWIHLYIILDYFNQYDEVGNSSVQNKNYNINIFKYLGSKKVSTVKWFSFIFFLRVERGGNFFAITETFLGSYFVKIYYISGTYLKHSDVYIFINKVSYFITLEQNNTTSCSKWPRGNC